MLHFWRNLWERIPEFQKLWATTFSYSFPHWFHYNSNCFFNRIPDAKSTLRFLWIWSFRRYRCSSTFSNILIRNLTSQNTPIEYHSSNTTPSNLNSTKPEPVFQAKAHVFPASARQIPPSKAHHRYFKSNNPTPDPQV